MLDTANFVRYGNRSGNSGVIAYALEREAIRVEFVGGSVYLYNQVTPGRRRVADMQRLAVSGEGLSAYIARHVGDDYAARLR